MHFVSFIIVLVFTLIAAWLFGSGLVKLHRGDKKSETMISSGFIVGVLGLLLAVIVFGFFSV